MKITFDNFKKSISAAGLHKANMHAIQRVHTIVLKQYCDKLTLRGACSEQCETCILNVRARLDRTQWETISNPYALLTYLLKDVTAGVVEQHQMAEKAHKPTVHFGAVVESDGLDLLLETL